MNTFNISRVTCVEVCGKKADVQKQPMLKTCRSGRLLGGQVMEVVPLESNNELLFISSH